MKIQRVDSSESCLVVNLFDKYRMFYKQLSDISLANTFIQERLDNNESVIFVALTENNNECTAVGFTQLYPKYSSVRAGKDWILNDLFIEEGYRKQRIGETLIRTAMEFAKSNGAKFLELSTGVANDNAQRLYERIGFEKQYPDTGFFNYKIILKEC